MFSVEFDPTLNKNYLILYYLCVHGIVLRDDNSLPIGTLGMDFLYEIGLKWIDDNNKSTRWDTGDIWKFSWLQQNIIASHQQKEFNCCSHDYDNKIFFNYFVDDSRKVLIYNPLYCVYENERFTGWHMITHQ